MVTNLANKRTLKLSLQEMEDGEAQKKEFISWGKILVLCASVSRDLDWKWWWDEGPVYTGLISSSHAPSKASKRLSFLH